MRSSYPIMITTERRRRADFANIARTTALSTHSTTNATIIQLFLGVDIRFEKESESIWRVTLQPSEHLLL
jgi:hypothetical protein